MDRPTPHADTALAPGAALAAAWHAHERDQRFLSMLRAFRQHGGLAREDAAAATDGPRATDVVIRFEWGGARWRPHFQFDPATGRPREVVTRVARELQHAMDGWALACWFAEPNAWLSGQRPVDLLDSDPTEIHAAARADRYVLG